MAWDLDRADWRTFGADRITPRTPTGPRFSPRKFPGGNASDYVTARFKGSDNVNAWPCTGTVILDLPITAVLPFAGDGDIEELGAERCIYTAGSSSWMALPASLARFDTDMEVVSPPELTEAFTRLAARRSAGATRDRGKSNRQSR